jgi:hypothetical protein
MAHTLWTQGIKSNKFKVAHYRQTAFRCKVRNRDRAPERLLTAGL